MNSLNDESPQDLHRQTANLADMTMHTLIFRTSLIGLGSLLGILLLSAYFNAQKQARTDIRNLNTILEARLAALPFEDMLSTGQRTISNKELNPDQSYDSGNENEYRQRIKSIFKQVEIGDHGIITIRNTSPIAILVRFPESKFTERLTRDKIDHRILSGETEGFLTMRSRIDHEDRLYGFRKIGNSTLVLVTGLSAKDYLSGWYYTFATTVAFCLALYTGAAIFIRHNKKHLSLHYQAAEERHNIELRSRLLVDTVGDAIFCIDDAGNCTFLNKTAFDFFGTFSFNLLGREALNSFFKGTDLDSREDFIGDVIDTVRDGTACYFETALFFHGSRGSLHVEIHAYAEKNASGAVVTLRDISARQIQQDRITFLAYHDPLTALPNRRLAEIRFAELCEQADVGFAMLYLDIDHFKTVNDSMGHIAGDELLQIIAARLLTVDRQIDTVARIGGDEFLIFIMLRSESSIDALIQKMLLRIAEPCILQQGVLSVTSSIGVSISSLHADSFAEMLKAADVSLYQAKRAGRNTWHHYEEKLGLREMRRISLSIDLRNALTRQELAIHYQPQVSLKDGKLIGIEALLRWNHPEKGSISPSEFIPLAEHSGLILPISYWLTEQVCIQAMLWIEMGIVFNTVAVNCSAVQFHQGDIVDDISRILKRTGLPAHMLELEITESLLIEDTERVLQVIQSLKTLGVQMSIDDFGTGYSSMAYLKRFPVDKIKIDQSFVRSMLVNPKDAAIVTSVIGLAHALKMTVIAEGVETYEISEALQLEGCDEAQGYFYARPSSASDITALLYRGNPALAQMPSGRVQQNGTFLG